MGKSREDALCAAQQRYYRDEERKMKREAARVRNILSKDQNWELAAGKARVRDDNRARFYRILASKTRKAVRMLYPDLPICIRWKHDDPDSMNRWIRIWVKVDPDFKKYGQTIRNIRTFLDELGLAFDTFYSDDADARRVSCVIVEHAPFTVRYPEKA